MNLVVVLLATLALVAGSYAIGRHDGKGLEIASQKKAEDFARESGNAAALAAATAIAGITVNHQNIYRPVEKTVRENVVYRDCQHDAATLRLLNTALEDGTAPADTAGGGELPEAHPAK